MKLLYAFLAVLCFSFPEIVKADEITDRIDKLVNDYISLGTFSGTVLVAKDGTAIYERAYGFEDREAGKPLTMSSRFNIGSMGKTFTAVAIMQYVEKGKLNLDSKLSEILPEYPFINADKMTLRQILSHTAGLSNYMGHPDYQKKKNEYTKIDDFLKLALEVPPAGAPGEKFEYSNTGFIVLGKIIEKLSGKDYFEHIRETLWGELGMNNTTVYRVNTKAENKAAGYELLPTGDVIYTGPNDIPALSDGGTFSNAYDLLTYAKALQRYVLLTEELSTQMFTQHAQFGPVLGYGYGFMIYNDKGKNVVGHGGDCPGYCADLTMMLDKGYTVIVLSNHGEFARSLNVRLLDILNGKEYPAPKKPISFVIYDALKEKGADYLTANMNAVLKEKGFDALPADWVLNNLGYTLLQNNRLDEAIQIFTINTVIYPGVANVWDSLGESYMLKGENDKAIIYYKKVLELDPANQNARAMIAKLEK